MNNKYFQIGNTCGFYSLVYCLDKLVGIDNPPELIDRMVKECKDENITTVGEVFDIDNLLIIAKKYFPQNVEVLKIELRNEKDILNLLKNAMLVFPVDSKGTPHYVSLYSSHREKIEYCNGGKIMKKSSKELYKLNKKIDTAYDWKKFKCLSSFSIWLGCKLYKMNKEEYKKYKEDNLKNKNNLRVLRKKGKENVNMRGYCLPIKKVDI